MKGNKESKVTAGSQQFLQSPLLQNVPTVNFIPIVAIYHHNYPE
jgi:hypothetical protein